MQSDSFAYCSLIILPTAMFLLLLAVQHLYGFVSGAPCEFIKTTSLDSDDGIRYVYTTNYRSTSDLVLSCLSTITLCTWFTAHPNVCRYKSPWTQRLLAKLGLFVLSLFVPELVMMFACRQWLGARHIAEKIGPFSEPPCTYLSDGL
jgi:hypothetical protein